MMMLFEEREREKSYCKAKRYLIQFCDDSSKTHHVWCEVCLILLLTRCWNESWWDENRFVYMFSIKQKKSPSHFWGFGHYYIIFRKYETQNQVHPLACIYLFAIKALLLPSPKSLSLLKRIAYMREELAMLCLTHSTHTHYFSFFFSSPPLSLLSFTHSLTHHQQNTILFHMNGKFFSLSPLPVLYCSSTDSDVH